MKLWPLVIFDAKGLNYEWTKGEIVGTMYGLSDSGWVDRDLFKSWMTQHFLKYAVGEAVVINTGWTQ